MPIEKKKTIATEPNHRQVTALWAIDSAWAELLRVLTFVSNNHPDMRAITKIMGGQLVEAKRLVLES